MIAGIDVGSTYLKVVWMNRDGIPTRTVSEQTGIAPDEKVRELLDRHPVRDTTVTGYGRHLIRDKFGIPTITEIKAHALAAYRENPKVNTVIDLGGQDSKVIQLKPDGHFGDFLMNDRCAAGTGKFLELAANRMEISLEKLDQLAMDATGAVSISSMCAVFAESEIISLLAKKEEPARIAAGIMESIAGKLANMVRKVGIGNVIMFTGGGARNRSLQHILSRKLDRTIHIPAHPQFMGAIGAALHRLQSS